jgi:phosphatidylglycerol:prolipoprotein diacylglycerol transferase
MPLQFPSIDPVAISIGPLSVHWYALAYLAGFLLGWRIARYVCRLDGNKIKPTETDMDDFMTWVILGVLLGGRLGYVLFYNFEQYIAEPLNVFKLWQGGMSFHGGLIGVLTAVFSYAVVKKIPVLRLADVAAVAAPIGFFFGRIANFVNGELFGRVTDAPWGMVFPRGGPEPRHPSQLYEAFFEGAVLFLIVMVLARRPNIRRHPGIIGAAFLFFYGIFRFGIEAVREPDVQLGLFFDMISMGQILCLPMIFGGIGLFLYARSRKPIDDGHSA